MIPLYGFLRGDTLGLLVLAEESDTAEELSTKLMQAAGVRVGGFERPVVVVRGRTLRAGTTVRQAHLTALDRFDVVPEEAR